MNTMTLHEAIEKLLGQTKRPMTAREIAEELNTTMWYSKGDKSKIKPSQIFARVDDHHELFIVHRSFSPHQIRLAGIQLGRVAENKDEVIVQKISMDQKKSFDPISNPETSIRILGTIPGDKSLELSEYYGHSRNRFWKIISMLAKTPLPLTYSEKKDLLLKSKIGLWDVAHKAIRKGSLDNAIQDEEPNDLDGFISEHKNLRVIGFNGVKSEALFDKYFVRRPTIRYFLLPSTSPANAGISFDNICKAWQQILK